MRPSLFVKIEVYSLVLEFDHEHCLKVIGSYTIAGGQRHWYHRNNVLFKRALDKGFFTKHNKQRNDKCLGSLSAYPTLGFIVAS